MEKIPKNYDNMHHIHINKHEYELIRIRIWVINACYKPPNSLIKQPPLEMAY